LLPVSAVTYDQSEGFTLAGVPLSHCYKEGRMRLKSHIWVSAYLRRLNAAFISAALMRRGDADAGAIYIKVAALDGTCQVFAPLSAELAEMTQGEQLLLEEGRAWQPVYSKSTAEAEADAYLARQAGRDPDIWILEVEAPEGRHLLGQGALALYQEEMR
jgi:hypothetical protein